MDREAWWATVHGVTKESDMTERLNTHTHTHTLALTKLGCLVPIRGQRIVLISLYVAFSKREGLYHVFMHEIQAAYNLSYIQFIP